MTTKKTRSKTAGAQSARRTLQLLAAIAHPGPAKTLEQLATSVGLAKSTAYRLLRLMEEEAFVDRQPNGGYCFGSSMVRLATSLVPETELFGLLQPHLQRMANETGETVTLHRRGGDQMVLVLGVEPAENLLRYVVRVGDMRPLTRGARGRVILAYLEPKELHRIMDEQPTDLDRAKLLTELEETRKLGYHLGGGENYPGLSAISVPVIAKEGDSPLLALVVSGPNYRWTTERRQAYAATMKARAREIAEILLNGRL